MKWWNKWEISRPRPGELIYSEPGRRYRFPIYDEAGEVVFVAWPTSQQAHFFIVSSGWTRVPVNFSIMDCRRITGRVISYFEQQGLTIRVIDRNQDKESAKFEFHPELFELRSQALECLNSAGITWLAELSSVDLLHEEFGLEICGIKEDSTAKKISIAMARAFPHWHFHRFCNNCDSERDPGWKFSIHMFPRRRSAS